MSCDRTSLTICCPLTYAWDKVPVGMLQLTGRGNWRGAANSLALMDELHCLTCYDNDSEPLFRFLLKLNASCIRRLEMDHLPMNLGLTLPRLERLNCAAWTPLSDVRCPKLQHLLLADQPGFPNDLPLDTLQTLDIVLRLSWLIGPGIPALVQRLQQLTSLTSLTITFLNPNLDAFGADNTTAVLRLLTAFPLIQHFSLTSCDLKDLDADPAVVSMVKRCPDLKSFHMNCMKMSDVALQAFARVSGLTFLCLTPNKSNMTTTGILTLMQGKPRLTLKKLQLHMRQEGDIDEALLEEGIQIMARDSGRVATSVFVGGSTGFPIVCFDLQ